MIQALKISIVTAVVMLGASLAAVTVSTTTHAQTIDKEVKCGSNIDLSGGSCNSTVAGSANDLNALIKTIINIFSAVVGAVSVIMIIVGGFRYITSGGDSNNVGAAKNTILYAIVGLVIVAVAQIIVQFVLERTT